MKEREAAALSAAGLLLSIAVLRMLAPALPFDWMTLLLVVFAAVAIVLPAMKPPRAPGPHGPGGAREPAEPGYAPKPFAVPEAMDTLRARMAASDWQAGGGGLFDSLRTLHQDRPFAAVCAARGLLLMLQKEAAPPPEDMGTLTLLMSAIDEMTAAGEDAADPRAVDDLFTYTLRALGRLERR